MGRPVVALQSEFPNMDWSYFEKDPNTVWWYDPTIPTPYNLIPKRNADSKINGNVRTELQIEEYEEWRPYGDGQFYMCPGEPEGVFQRRMEALRLWIYDTARAELLDEEGDENAVDDAPPSPRKSDTSNPSTEPRTVNVLTIGHWGVYKYFTNGTELENCQICTVDL